MEVIVTRKYENDFKYDESEPDYHTEEIKFDSETFDEALKGLCCKGRKLVSADRLLSYVYDGAIGKITTSGDSKFIPQLIFGDLGISIQCHYQLYSARIDKYGVDGADLHKDDPMTQEDWGAILGKADREDYPYDVYFDVCVYRKSDQHMLIRPCQLTLRMLSLRLNDLLNLHRVED